MAEHKQPAILKAAIFIGGHWWTLLSTVSAIAVGCFAVGRWWEMHFSDSQKVSMAVTLPSETQELRIDTARLRSELADRERTLEQLRSSTAVEITRVANQAKPLAMERDQLRHRVTELEMSLSEYRRRAEGLPTADVCKRWEKEAQQFREKKQNQVAEIDRLIASTIGCCGRKAAYAEVYEAQAKNFRAEADLAQRRIDDLDRLRDKCIDE